MGSKYSSEIEIKGDVKHALRKLDDLNTKLDELNRQSKKSTSGVSSNFIKMGATIAAVGLTVNKAWNQFIDPASDLQSEMTNVFTLTNLSAGGIEKLTEKVHQLSLGVPKSAAELAAGLYQVVSAGVDANNQLAVLNISARAATAGVASTTDSLLLGSAVIKAYGKDWKDFEHIQDQAFKTVELGQTTFGELAQNIQKNTAQFNQLGVATEELFGLYATLTGVTGNTAEVSTQLRGVMTGLIRPKKELIALIKEEADMTVEQYVQTNGLIKTLGLLKEKTGGSAAALGKMFESQEALTALGALLTTQYDTLIEKTGKITESSGTMNVAFEKQMNTFENQAKILSNKLQPALVSTIAEFTSFLKIVNDYLDVPLSERLGDEKIEFNALFEILKDVNAEQSTRNYAIRELMDNYGGYIGNIDLETANYVQLANAQKTANAEFERKIRLQAAQEILKEAAQEVLEQEKKVFELQKEVNEETERGIQNYNTLIPQEFIHQSSLAYSKTLLEELKVEYGEISDALLNQGFSLGENNTVLDEHERKLESTTAAVNKYKEAVKGAGEETKKSKEITKEWAIQQGAASGDVMAAIRNVIKAKFALMIAGFLEKEIGSKGLVGLITGAAGAALAMGMFEKLVPKFHEGGLVRGGGEFPAILQGGEYVFNRNAVRDIGIENLNRANQAGGTPATNEPNQVIQIGIAVTPEEFVRDYIMPIADDISEKNLA